MDLSEAADRRFGDYSSGMKQRLAVARALLHDPPVLIMDEPTRSLDPSAARHLREFVRDRLNGEHGKTILLATHNLDEAEWLCHRLAILSKGKVRRAGTVEDIRAAESPRDRYRVYSAMPPPVVMPSTPWRGCRGRWEIPATRATTIH